MLPTLSRLSVSLCPDSRLRHWCSSRSLRISPLHREFRYPLHHSSPAVSKAGPALKTGVSLQTYKTTYAPFTPSHSGQRLLPTYYRGCWHVVSRSFLAGYRLLLVPCNRGLRSENLLPSRGVAGSGLRPLPNIPTAASRRSLDRFSVPMWPVILSDRLPIVDLVGRYLTNYLMGRELTLKRISPLTPCPCELVVSCGISNCFQLLSPS